MSKEIGLVLLALLSQGLAGCAVNPVTGNSDFVMMSEQQELAMGRQYNQVILQQQPRYADEKLQGYVQQVGQRVASQSHRSNLNYQFTVIDSPDINAFALPGGFIYINRGLLAYLSSEAELAAVLGHEVGHVTARHSVRQQSQSQAWGILGQVVAVGTGVGMAGDLTSVLGNAVVSGYGRDMELESDGLGAQYLARSGYDPQAMIEVVKVLKNQEDFSRDQALKEGKEAPPSGYHGLFDTHPDNDTRLKQVVGPAQALATGQQEVNRDAFLRHLEGLPFGGSAASGVHKGQQFYHADMNFALSIPPGWELLNQPDAVIIHTADERAFIAMTVAPMDQRLTPEEALRRKVGNQRLSMTESVQGKDVQGVTAVLPGNPAKRVALLVKGGQAYQFIAAVKGGGSLESQDDHFLEVIRSFRSMSKADLRLAEPIRLHMVKVKSGDTIESMAKPVSGLSGDPVARLRLLNGLYPAGQPSPGSLLKILR